jgi:hypothetical protein
MAMAFESGRLQIEFWEDWGMDGRPGENAEIGFRTEPIWHATLADNRWLLVMNRRWKVADGLFGPHAIELDLAGFDVSTIAV